MPFKTLKNTILIEKILRFFLIFGGGYFLFDALLHFLGIKLSSVVGVWPESSISYGSLINYIYASFVILAALIAFILANNLKKYKSIIGFSAIWALFHAALLLFLVLTQNYQQIFKDLPSLLVWLPFYREYLALNAIVLLTYSGVVYIWLFFVRVSRSF